MGLTLLSSPVTRDRPLNRPGAPALSDILSNRSLRLRPGWDTIPSVDMSRRVRRFNLRGQPSPAGWRPLLSSEADRAVADYNAVVGQYNSACANHPFDSATVAEVRAHLSCPAPR